MRKSRCWTYQSASRLGSGEAMAVCSRPRNINQNCSKRPGGTAYAAGALLAHVVPVDSDDVAERLDEVRAFDLGSCDVLPLFERILIDPVCRDVGGSDSIDIARQKFDIEDPTRQEWFVEQRSNLWSNPQGLGATLRVIDRQPQHHGDDGGENTPQIVPRKASSHVAAEQLYARAENHIQIRMLLQDCDESWDGIQGRCQIGVPIARIAGGSFQREVDTSPDGLGLALIDLELEYMYAVLV